MNAEHVPNSYEGDRLPTAPEGASLEDLFEQRRCPFCGTHVEDGEQAHFGFCEESCFKHYTENDPEKQFAIRTAFKAWDGAFQHREWLQEHAEEFGVPVDMVRELCDVQGLSMADIRQKLQKERDQESKAA